MLQAMAFLWSFHRYLHCASVLGSAWRFTIGSGNCEGVICSVIDMTFIQRNFAFCPNVLEHWSTSFNIWPFD